MGIVFRDGLPLHDVTETHSRCRCTLVRRLHWRIFQRAGGMRISIGEFLRFRVRLTVSLRALIRLRDKAWETPSSRAFPTEGQRCIAGSLFERASIYGDAPDDLTPASALAEIARVKDLYTQEPDSLAAYDVEKLAVLRRERFQSIPLAKVLTPEACGLYKSFATVIERTPSEISHIPIGAIPERPYWDPKLRRSRKIRFALYKELFRLGILTFRSGIKAKAALFFVKKKDGTIRLIVDGRQANAYHRRPPHSCLATPGILSELDMADFGTGCGELAEAEPCGN